MTEAATSSLQQFIAQWAANLTAALRELAAESPTVNVTDPIPPTAEIPEQTAAVSARFVCGGSLQGELLWLADSAVAQRFAQLQSPQLAASTEFTEAHIEAFFDFLRKVSSLTVAAWRQSTSTETLISFHSAAEPAFSAQLESEFRVSSAQIPESILRLQLNPELCTSLAAADAPQSNTNARAASHTSEAVPFIEPEAGPPPARPVPGNLDLLLDVELEATIRFGEREMLLREVMGLMPGAVVELDQMVNEPADLLVAGRLVARGEVVVVDGNFGLRVTEVASASQRAQLVPHLGKD
jgi:flagellar motor switch protein FliN/FliY